jgi:uncharacterized membrane protein
VIYRPAAPPVVLLLALLFVVFVILVELQVLAYAYQKIGVRPRYVFGLMLLTLLGSHVNIPLYSIPVERIIPPHTVWFFGLPYEIPGAVRARTTLVAVNVGGALIPALLSVYLLVWTRMWGRMLVGVIVVTLVVHGLAAIVPGVGVVVPTLVPAGAALLIAFRRAPPGAYVAGSMGTLVGADLLNLGRVAHMNAPVVSIGGAGTFDGVFLTGLIAGLLV